MQPTTTTQPSTRNTDIVSSIKLCWLGGLHLALGTPNFYFSLVGRLAWYKNINDWVEAKYLGLLWEENISSRLITRASHSFSGQAFQRPVMQMTPGGLRNMGAGNIFMTSKQICGARAVTQEDRWTLIMFLLAPEMSLHHRVTSWQSPLPEWWGPSWPEHPSLSRIVQNTPGASPG